MFKLDPQLCKDCHDLGRMELCRVLLMNDSNYPWFILVPEVPDLTEIYQLGAERVRQLADESARFAETIAERFSADKINVAALGNVVSQLHVHHIVRYRSDVSWPAPVWGRVPPVAYSDSEVAGIRERIADLLQDT